MSQRPDELDEAGDEGKTSVMTACLAHNQSLLCHCTWRQKVQLVSCTPDLTSLDESEVYDSSFSRHSPSKRGTTFLEAVPCRGADLLRIHFLIASTHASTTSRGVASGSILAPMIAPRRKNAIHLLLARPRRVQGPPNNHSVGLRKEGVT